MFSTERTRISYFAHADPQRPGFRQETRGSVVEGPTVFPEYSRILKRPTMIKPWSYSSRITVKGSTRVARIAGIKLAAKETSMSSMVTAANVTRSRELTP
jgi:hypothetical protein